ncbi:prolipoprotein diacylglyceryl transferase [Hwanghaeella grinnelliae]|uniref:Phosphatidylglycerol--prolipoprotein diacylglyceryl transferase n=1 Tax=Hwanghaeella grinnelliae TaxID=2500179 RepID=A0A3S2Z8R0_9PROT|nr:prolipoprotein diacylglyceryl transferase [Hwanghaeella grinnelliae]RVU37955.1 prolipoprotein diacylglyceryl transferase [Hwanghaeella grinnelliae]
MPFPDISPIALELGPIAIRWYALAYLAGIIIGWRYCMAMAKRLPTGVSAADMDDFMVWAVAGIILGGRLGQVIFYQPGHFLQHPLEIFMVWQGGMAFHGGLLGVIAAMVIYTRRRDIPFFAFTDLIALAAPIGIFFGRIANFINQEHFGRPADVPWAIIFNTDALQVPRHPSQLYEAAMEGLILYLTVAAVAHGTRALRQPGIVTGIFLIGYAIARMIGEFFREPEVFVESLPFATTWGQWLSLPMLAVGLYVLRLGLTRQPVAQPAK